MEFNLGTTIGLFVALIALGAIGMTMTPMTTRTIYMMVVPSMVVYGLIVLWLGVKHGEQRASGR